MSNKDEHIIISTPVASIYKKPNFTSELVTQALIWESLNVCGKEGNWYKIKQYSDGYTGWIHSFYIVDSRVKDKNEKLQDPYNWYWVKDKFLELKSDNSQTYFISYGSLIPCLPNIENTFYTVLPNNEKIALDKKSLIKFNIHGDVRQNDFKQHLLYSIKELLGTPYLWGGKSSYGFDCSGLVQSIIKVSTNFLLPRDSSLQIKSKFIKEMRSMQTPQVGDLIFFKINDNINHVGLYINDIDFIHASGCVRINSINKKSKYYCKDLAINYYGTYKPKYYDIKFT